MKKFNYRLEIEIFLKGVLFKGLGVQKGTQTPCWLRPCLLIIEIKNNILIQYHGNYSLVKL